MAPPLLDDVAGGAYMGARQTVIVVGACMIGLAVGCGGERSSPEPDVREEPAAVVGDVDPAPSADEGTAPDRRIVGSGCWAADVELRAGDCRSAHVHIADALSACSAKGGEAIAVDMTQACSTGFRAAAITCCSPGARARARVTAPPTTLPEPIAADPTVTSVGECSTSSAVTTEAADCARDTSITEAVADLVASHAASGEEIRSYRFFARCKDGGFAGFASSSCTPGYRRE